jgi:CheY-like chemotaxis protein
MVASQVEIASSFRKITILLVDDQEDYRYLLRDEIEELLPDEIREDEENISIYDVGSGMEALKFVEDNPVDIIVLDYEMPDINGADVLVQLKQLGVTKTAIGLTRLSEPVLSEMEASCALKAFCKDNKQQFYAFLMNRINELCADVI